MSLFADTQRALQSHILDGNAAAASLIDDDAKAPAELRLRVYSDAYRLRLIEALAANYPVIAQVLGEEDFSRLTQVYLTIKPSQHFSIRWFGHKLPAFLRSHLDYAPREWLAELADWEWSVAHAFDAIDVAPLSLEKLAQVSPGEWPTLTFTIHPSARRIKLKSNVVDIVQAAGNGESLPNPMSRLESNWLIWRYDLSVRYRTMDIDEADAFDAIANGDDFASMCERLSEHMDSDDVPLRAMMLIKQWTEDQLLTAIDVPSN